ncbi:phosphomannomutase [Sphaerochaeta pleomorpha str. Grapes]|uniref:Phosphomannomutase n=1 Tax=Sphaerochaeta pleomorpha (strain ATCC BAA-1885 / DSM 22778 / Grapes) TaxID=158190 RepID=G8QVZ2_SPHPG|nr:phosphoglucomutase [Sphaerochaeta pleomorpha]AEV30516.1 phosphomannomutase [Sphaerochaeta pleomorpha str. Grapes]
MLIYDYLSHLPIADDQLDPLDFTTPSQEQLNKALEGMILSASGWRKVFAVSGNEEDNTSSISDPDSILAAFAALSLARHLGVKKAQESSIDSTITRLPEIGDAQKTVLVGLDSRPTGQILGDIVCRTLTALGVKVRYLFICAAPEIMADCNLFSEEADAFLYISASHNPVGHNGIKFGKQGGVYTGQESALLANTFRSLVANPEAARYVQKLSSLLDEETYHQVLSDTRYQKQQSLERYETFVLGTACKSFVNDKIRTFSRAILEGTETNPIGIVAELNGSARSVSIDYSLFNSLGIRVYMLNNQPGKIVHAIVPEGENLELCRRTLEDQYKRDSCYKLGYVPDNDGDRGNLVYIKDSNQKAVIMEAQEVFALVVLVELCQARLDNPKAKIAIAVNGPTSMRIDRIAKKLNVEVFRSEVGEANVVELATRLRSDGYIVNIFGEGSNGGNITYPAKVRDPMNTLMSLIKLISDKNIFRCWCRTNGKDLPKSMTYENIINSLPSFTSTGAFSTQAKMQVTVSQKDLKNAYEEIFLLQWEERKSELLAMGIEDYVAYQMEGTVCTEGLGETFRTPPYKGGHKIVFLDKDGLCTDFIWMRGSGTEPVFRVMADCEGSSQKRHDYLLAWQRDMIAKADQLARTRN